MYNLFKYLEEKENRMTIPLLIKLNEKYDLKINLTDEVEALINSMDSLKGDFLYGCIWGAERGEYDLVKLLLENDNGNTNFYSALEKAVENKHPKIVELFLKDGRTNPGMAENILIQIASEIGDIEVFKLLLSDERVDPSDFNNYALRQAIEFNHPLIVKLLLNDERVDPSDMGNYRVKLAHRMGHMKILKLLLQDERVKNKMSNNEYLKYIKHVGITENFLVSDAIGYEIGDYIYHVTPKDNIPNIEKKGFVPKDGIAINNKPYENRLYFATSLIAAYDLTVNFNSYREYKEYAIFKLDAKSINDGYEIDPLFQHGIYIDYPIEYKYVVDKFNSEDLFDKFEEDDLDNLYL